MDDLFSKKENIQIISLTNNDVKFESDHINNFERLILENESMYPNIDKWYKNKVLPGLKSGKRAAFLGYFQEKPMISAVVKKGKSSKICHLKVGKDFQNQNLGEIFFTLMVWEVRNISKELHFTLPENLWHSKGDFFKEFGFTDFTKSETQYRSGIEELKCSAPFNDVWKQAIYKMSKLLFHYSLGGFSNDNRLLLSIKPKYVDSIFEGKKKIEIRRRFNKKWNGENISIYASAPRQELVGQAKIKDIIEDNPEKIWDEYQADLGVSKTEYESYTQKTKKVYAIFLDEIKPYQGGIPLSQISYLLQSELKPPQSYYTLDSDSNRNWQKAISIATFLHSNFKEKNIPIY